ncbi:MAG TPA: TlpA disulfide reductase family protein [Paludibacteraceae bacterium]|nr:TlpA disulfide reductase family protein [Paludibacteraceae bacterium]
MKKLCVLFLLTFLIIPNSFGKNYKQFYFKIDGTINADTGTVYLNFYSEYIPNKTKELTARVKNNKFTISGYIPEPQAVNILLDDRYMSSDFIIEKGLQTISINTDSTRKVPVVLNKTMINEYPKYEAYFEKMQGMWSRFYQKEDSFNMLHNRQLPKAIKLNLDKEYSILCDLDNKTLLQYSQKSHIAFWRLIRTMNWGYEPIFDSIYNSFSSELKNGYAGRVLKIKLDNGRLLSVGKQYPLLQCVNRNNEKFSPTIFLKNKLTLLDFWYSGCGPCRAQFNSLKNLYTQFGNKGFEIVGISVDRETDKKKWEDIIINEKLSWQHYWDMNGKEANRLSIRAFPTNFLIDNTGKIIAKNISVEELEVLLSKSL